MGWASALSPLLVQTGIWALGHDEERRQEQEKLQVPEGYHSGCGFVKRVKMFTYRGPKHCRHIPTIRTGYKICGAHWSKMIKATEHSTKCGSQPPQNLCTWPSWPRIPSPRPLYVQSSPPVGSPWNVTFPERPCRTALFKSTAPLLADTLYPSAYFFSRTFITWQLFVHCLTPSSPACKLYKGTGFFLSCSMLYSQCLEQWLVLRHLINIYGINEWNPSCFKQQTLLTKTRCKSQVVLVYTGIISKGS